MTATADSDSESYWQARAQWTGPAAAAATVTGPAARQPGTVSGPGPRCRGIQPQCGGTGSIFCQPECRSAGPASESVSARAPAASASTASLTRQSQSTVTTASVRGRRTRTPLSGGRRRRWRSLRWCRRAVTAGPISGPQRPGPAQPRPRRRPAAA